MTLNQLRYFCTAAQCHSITKAAKLMFVTQPAVSLALRELEKEFSITLFSHSNNGLELTVEGEQFYERASALLRQSDEMQLEFQDTSRRRPTVRLGTPPNLSTVFFPELMDAFHVEHPEIYLDSCDFVLTGEGETSFSRLCSILSDTASSGLSAASLAESLPGAVCRKEGKIC